MEYDASTLEDTTPTIVSLTNHGYWDLAGHASGSVMGHELELMCSAYTPTVGGKQGAPTGEIAPVAGTAFDLRGGGHVLGTQTACIEMQALAADGTLVTSRGGLDHSYVSHLPQPQPQLHARL